jgi:predicted PurR-regulated permease PerM
MLVTTAGTLLFGLLGAILAAPVTAVTLRTIAVLREAACLRRGPRRLDAAKRRHSGG